MTKAEETLIDTKFILDMYSAGVDMAKASWLTLWHLA